MKDILKELVTDRLESGNIDGAVDYLQDMLGAEEEYWQDIAIELISGLGTDAIMRTIDNTLSNRSIKHCISNITCYKKSHYEYCTLYLMLSKLPDYVKLDLLPYLMDYLIFGSDDKRKAALDIIPRLGVVSEETIIQLIEIVKARAIHYTFELTKDALALLANFKEHGKKALPYLDMLLKNDTERKELRILSAQAISSIADNIQDYQSSFLDAQIDGFTFHDSIEVIYKSKIHIETEEIDPAAKITEHIHKLVSQGIEPFAFDEPSQREIDLKSKVEEIFRPGEDD